MVIDAKNHSKTGSYPEKMGLLKFHLKYFMQKYIVLNTLIITDHLVNFIC